MTSVGSIRADVSKRLLIPAALTALLTAACGSIPSATGVDYGSGPRFVTAVMDSLDNVGQGSAVAVDANGTVFASYLGFPAETKGGAVPPAGARLRAARDDPGGLALGRVRGPDAPPTHPIGRREFITGSKPK